MALDAAVVTTLATAFAAAHGAGSPSTAETTLAQAIIDAMLNAEGIPNTTTFPLLDSLGAPVTGKTQIT